MKTFKVLCECQLLQAAVTCSAGPYHGRSWSQDRFTVILNVTYGKLPIGVKKNILGTYCLFKNTTSSAPIT